MRKSWFRYALYEVLRVLAKRNLVYYRVFRISDVKNTVFFRGRPKTPSMARPFRRPVAENPPPPRPRKSDVLVENTVQGERIERLFGTPGGRGTKSPPSGHPSLQPVRLFGADLTRAVARKHTFAVAAADSSRYAKPRRSNSGAENNVLLYFVL